MTGHSQAGSRLWNEAMARRYDPEAYHLRSCFAIRWLERLRIGTILSFLEPRAQDRVLEVGCGAGNVLEQVPSRRLYGIDLSTHLIARSRLRLAHLHPHLAQADGVRLPFASDLFHKLICSEVLEHVPDPRSIVAEMARVAAPGAILVLSIPNERWINRTKRMTRALRLRSPLPRPDYQFPEEMTDEWHLHSFSLPLLFEVCKGILVIRQVRGIPLSATPLRYVAQCQVDPGLRR